MNKDSGNQTVPPVSPVLPEGQPSQDETPQALASISSKTDPSSVSEETVSAATLATSEEISNSTEPLPVPEAPAPSEEEPSSPPVAKPAPVPGFAVRCFGALSFAAPLILIILWAIQTLPLLRGRTLCGLHELCAGLQTQWLGIEPWLSEQTASTPLAAIQPVYTWFLHLLSFVNLTALTETWPVVPYLGESNSPLGSLAALQPVAAGLAGLLLLLTTWGLARVTGNDRKTALGSGLVLLVGFAFIGWPCLAADEVLSAALMTLASMLLYSGWVAPFAPGRLILGFMFIVCSTLAGGLLGLILPLCTCLLFLLWRGTFRRAGARDGALAFGIMLILLCAWGTLIAFSEGGRDTLKAELTALFLEPLQSARELRGQDAGILPATLLLLWFPWTLLVFFLPWERIGGFCKRIVTNRKERPGQGWLWWSVLTGLGVTALLGGTSPLLLLPVFPPLAILTAQGILQLSERRSRLFFLVLSLIFFLLGLFYTLLTVLPLLSVHLPAGLQAVQPVESSILEAVSRIVFLFLIWILLWKGTRRSFPSGSLLAVTLLTTLLVCVSLNADLLHPVAAQSPTQQTVPVKAPAQEEVPAVQQAPESMPAVPAPQASPAAIPAETSASTELKAPAEDGLPSSPVEAKQPAEATPVSPEASAATSVTTPDAAKTKEAPELSAPKTLPAAPAPAEGSPSGLLPAEAPHPPAQ